MIDTSDSVRPEVSFVVIAHNEEAGITSSISSIMAQDGGASYEIVIVDDGSTDRSAELVMEMAANHPQIVLVRHLQNMGRGAARSTGIDKARGDFVAMVDSDIVLPKNWLQRCRLAISESEADAVGGIAVPDGDVAYVHKRFALVPKIAPMAISVSGSNGLYRRQVFDLVEIDRSLVEGEDVALNHAMMAAGLRCKSIDDLIVKHNENKSFIASVLWLFQTGKGATRQFVDYRNVRTPDLALAGQMVAIMAGLVARRRWLNRNIALALPFFYLVVVSGAHMAGKFNFKRSERRFVLATAMDALFIGSYFAGRIVGIPSTLGRRTTPENE
jgi:glycosyltransferase involved in cell wall biosynthesis